MARSGSRVVAIGASALAGALLVAGGLLGIGAFSRPADDRPAGRAPAPPPTRVGAPVEVADPGGQAEPSASADADFAASLAGTTPDGALVLDASGAFVPTPDALDFFDYYLSVLGERSLDEITAVLEREIRARVDPPDAALRLLGQYLDYRDAVRELVAIDRVDAIPLEQRLQWLRETRREAFGPALAERLFGEEEARLRDSIERRRILRDASLDAAERDARIAELDAALPEAERERRARVTLARRVLDREARMRDEGRSDDEVDAWRRREFGDDAAGRLAALDARRAAWAARLAEYRARRDALRARPGLDGSAAAAELEALRAQLFEGPELVRVRALDAAEAR